MFHVEQAWREAFIDGAAELRIPLAPHQIELFQQYLQELLEWNQRINLTAITDERQVAVKHFLDSLAVSQSLIAGSLLDIGTGAGFPGLPLKILEPQRSVTLLESNRKKAAFLHHVIGTLRLGGTTVIPKRLEQFSGELQSEGRTGVRITFANVVTRAVAIVSWLSYIRPLLADDGRFIWCRATPLAHSLEHTGFRLIREERYSLPGGFGDRLLAVLQPS